MGLRGLTLPGLSVGAQEAESRLHPYPPQHQLEASRWLERTGRSWGTPTGSPGTWHTLGASCLPAHWAQEGQAHTSHSVGGETESLTEEVTCSPHTPSG